MWLSGRIFRIWSSSAPSTGLCLIKRLRQMAEFPHRLLVVTSTLSQMRSRTPTPALIPTG